MSFSKNTLRVYARPGRTFWILDDHDLCIGETYDGVTQSQISGEANAKLFCAAAKMYAQLKQDIVGYGVLKTVCEKSGLSAGADAAQYHIDQINILLAEAGDES